MSTSDPKRELLRHTVATLAYRGGKAVRNPPAGFTDFNGAGRTPGQILAHLGDLFDWALSIATGNRTWRNSKPQPWDEEVERLFTALKRFDDYLASTEPLHATAEKLFQGPIADALTHVGQLAMMRRLAGNPISGESYYDADITIGRVGADQTPPKRTF
jgi:hypothetical protein